jgi:WD40 repeat protein
MTFNGFISYSHAADGRLAPAVQRGLHRLAKPWHRRRALWIFRDQTGLSVTPGLWSSIQTALDGSEYFVLLASPEAAASRWVNREIEHWMATKSAERILPVVTAGEWDWDQELHDFTEGSTAVPAALRGVFAEEPLFLDLRWARGSEHLSLQHSRFRDAIAQLAAPMHGVSKDELEGEDVRQHRRARRLRSGAVVSLLVLALVAALTGVSAVRNAERARDAAAEALRQEQVANVQRGSAERSAEEALRQQKLAQEQQELARQEQERARQQQARAVDASAAADQAERLAGEQQKLADQAAKEARRQQRLADQAATRTLEQQRLARQASEKAQAEEKEARRLAKIAEQQRRQAREAAAEARRQQNKADEQQARADEQQRIAVSRRLITQAQARIVDDPRTALMLGVAAQKLQSDTESRGQLAGLVTGTNYAGTINDVTRAVYGPGDTVVTRNNDGAVSLWNVAKPQHPVRLATIPERADIDSTLVLSPDGRTLAVSNDEGTVSFWNVANRSRPVRLGGLSDDGGVISLAYSPDGRTFATGDGWGVTTLWNVRDRERPVVLATLTDFGDSPVEDLAFSPDGRMLVGNKGSFVPVWEVARPQRAKVLYSLPGTGMTSLAFAPRGATLAAGSLNGTVDLYDLTREPAEPSRRLGGLAGQVRAIGYSPDGRHLAAGDGQGTAMVWDLKPGYGPGPVTTVRAHGQVNAVALGAKGRTLLTADSSATATLWNVAAGGTPDLLSTIAVPGGGIQATTFRPDGRALTVADADGMAHSWSVNNPARPVRGADRALNDGWRVRKVAFSPDNRAVAAVALQGGELTLTDLTRRSDPVVVADLSVDPRSATALAFSPDGRTLAAVADSGTMMLWNVSNRARPTLQATVRSDSGFGMALAFSPDGRTLATGNANARLALWDVTKRSAPKRLAAVSAHSAAVDTVAFSPDGRTLASGSLDASAMLWDVTDRADPRRLAMLTGHTNGVESVRFSPEGHTLATGGGDEAMILWDTTDPAAPVRVAALRTGVGGNARAVTFRGDGRTLAVTGHTDDEGAKVTLLDYTKLNNIRADPARFACAITGRGLTTGEWGRYVPEFAYRRTCPS